MNAVEYFYSLPEKVQDNVLHGLETNIHFELEGEAGGTFGLIIKDGTLQVFEEFIGIPKCVVKAKAEHFMAIVNGELHPMMAMMTGKIKMTHPGEMLKFAKILGLM